MEPQWLAHGPKQVLKSVKITNSLSAVGETEQQVVAMPLQPRATSGLTTDQQVVKTVKSNSLSAEG